MTLTHDQCTSTNAVSDRSISQTCSGDNPPPNDGCGKDDNDGIFYIFAAAQLFIAAGAAPLYIHGNIWLDENVPADKLGIFIGGMLACGGLGPAIGFAFGGVFLGAWVDGGGAPLGLEQEDKEWVGNWSVVKQLVTI
jgi:MFS family permease